MGSHSNRQLRRQAHRQPGAVPATSTYALANATIGYGLALANKGWQRASDDDAGLALGLNVHEGKIMYAAVAKAHNL